MTPSVPPNVVSLVSRRNAEELEQDVEMVKAMGRVKKALDELAAKANEGEYVGAAIVMLTPEGNTEYIRSGYLDLKVVGTLDLLKNALLHDLMSSNGIA